jgi:hypothetical protein
VAILNEGLEKKRNASFILEKVLTGSKKETVQGSTSDGVFTGRKCGLLWALTLYPSSVYEPPGFNHEGLRAKILNFKSLKLTLNGLPFRPKKRISVVNDTELYRI